MTENEAKLQMRGVAARRAAQFTQELRRLFPGPYMEYERQCITSEVLRAHASGYLLRITWERLDHDEAIQVLNKVRQIAGNDDATCIRYSRFDADVEVVTSPSELLEVEEKTGDQVAAEARLEDAEAAWDASHPALPEFQEQGEVEVLLTPHDLISMLDGTRLGVQEINGKKAYARMETADEHIAWIHREQAKAEVEGRFFPEQPPGWENDVRRNLTPLPREAVAKLLGVRYYG